MHILLLFLDGIGLGDDNPDVNPFVVAKMPDLTALTNGKRWLRDTGRQESERAIFIPTDPRLGVAGRPQSATGQAAILTGKNVPQLLGEHYGPKPTRPSAKSSRRMAFSSASLTVDKKRHCSMLILRRGITKLIAGKVCVPVISRRLMMPDSAFSVLRI